MDTCLTAIYLKKPKLDPYAEYYMEFKEDILRDVCFFTVVIKTLIPTSDHQQSLKIYSFVFCRKRKHTDLERQEGE